MSDTIPSLPTSDQNPLVPAAGDTAAHTAPHLPVAADPAPATGPMQAPLDSSAGDTIINRPPPPPAVPPPPPPPAGPPPVEQPGGISLPMVLAVFGLALVGIVLLIGGIF
ncbi:MAG TPA: hypothetical protein VM536_14425, partial [Chloroflexia bacterium]|nr:hypothetical protein [Chloroflexia bacterium]